MPGSAAAATMQAPLLGDVMFPNTQAVAFASADDPRDWLEHCEGFRVDGPEGRLGWVEELEYDLPGRVTALLIRRHHIGELLRLPATAVLDVEPEHGRILIADPRLLQPTTRRGASPDFRCRTCGYGATALTAPARCPMCGRRTWDSLERRSHGEGR